MHICDFFKENINNVIFPCSVDQVRSLASTMHNSDNFFQYFVVDFENMDSAFHGSTIVSQAAFVNDALVAIRKLYIKKRGIHKKEKGKGSLC